MKHTIIIIIILVCYSCDRSRNEIPDTSYELYITEGSDKQASISPDGKHIAYCHYGISSESPDGLYIIDINGNNKRLIREGNYADVTWGPDNKSIVASNQGILEKLDLNGNIILSLKHNVPLFSANYSPDGTKLIFASSYAKDGGVFISNDSFQNIRRVFTPGIYACYEPVWISDSTVICSTTSSDNWKGYEICFSDTAFNELRRLTFTNGGSKSGLNFCHHSERMIFRENGKIVLSNIDGTNKKVVATGSHPDISEPENLLIYSFSSPDRKRGVIYSTDLNGNETRQITF